MNALFRSLLICSIILTIPLVVLADIYKYRDADGRLNFVDDESKIPPEFRNSMTSISEAEDPPAVYDSPKDKQRKIPLLFMIRRKISRNRQRLLPTGKRLPVPHWRKSSGNTGPLLRYETTVCWFLLKWPWVIALPSSPSCLIPVPQQLCSIAIHWQISTCPAARDIKPELLVVALSVQ